MKLQRLAASAAILTTTVGATLAPIVALAETGTYTDATHASAIGAIEFTEDNTPTKPVNPENPDETVDPNDKDVNPNGAELMITYASDLHFGKQSKSETSWNALADKIKDPANAGQTKDIVPFVSVKDSRGTERNGWTLTVQQDGDFKKGDDVLTGAALKFSGLNYASGPLLPTAVTGDLTLSDSAQKIASADKTTGAGNTSLALGQLQSELDTVSKQNVNKTPGVNLSIPNGTIINTGTYQTTITYELTAGV